MRFIFALLLFLPPADIFWFFFLCGWYLQSAALVAVDSYQQNSPHYDYCCISVEIEEKTLCCCYCVHFQKTTYPSSTEAYDNPILNHHQASISVGCVLE